MSTSTVELFSPTIEAIRHGARAMVAQEDAIVLGIIRDRLRQEVELRDLIGRLQVFEYPAPGRREYVLDGRLLATFYPTMPTYEGTMVHFDAKYTVHA